jgi:hypothetical protein
MKRAKEGRAGEEPTLEEMLAAFDPKRHGGEVMSDDLHPVAVLVTGGIWATRPVSEEPSITLTSWAIIETVEDKPSRHFVGYNFAGREGRVSSPIVTFDAETMRGVTHTSRVYQLQGSPGLNGDAEYVLGRWQRGYKVDVTDITDIVIKEAS